MFTLPKQNLVYVAPFRYQTSCESHVNQTKQFSVASATVSSENREFSECEDQPKRAPNRARLGAFFARALRGASDGGALSSRPFLFPRTVWLRSKRNAP